MIKNKFLFAGLMFLISLSLFANQPPHFYNDYKNGYSGSAFATFKGTVTGSSEQEILSFSEEAINTIATKTGLSFLGQNYKLSKEEIFLLWSALDEYNYKKDELYFVQIAHDPKYGPFLSLAVVINDDEKTVRIYVANYYKASY